MSYHLSKPIVIADYDPQWPLLYEQERQQLTTHLAPILQQIEHIGSTSVPGLGAKPIIDISVSVLALSDVDDFVPALARLGYEDANINPIFQRRLFCKGPYNEGTHHLHFTVHGSTTWKEPILLRDYLRVHPDEAAHYQEVKRMSAAKHQSDLNGYHEEKSGCVQALLEKAHAWGEFNLGR
ncbi:GrpB family protein [Armatimonas rosea]|uniref:GrpB-like predicted nucleotidyltransferase (UPF0157 family) n=1 Tax=Armatimonas rosea TaxID=685828 RepID=A0A7W9SM50_ARMRO|nr:GrpB family protein [Armatimonas rosea]MBB6049160.1 GrpB-like predicted nucleotidyltransferase (UPF0157 family) [Armatimonas rosea]